MTLEPLWTDDKINSSLDAATERKVEAVEARALLHAMQGDYEEYRATREQTIETLGLTIQQQNTAIANLQSGNSALAGDVMSLQGQVGTLSQSNDYLAGSLLASNAANTTLQLQVADLSPDVHVTIKDTVALTSKFETAVSHVASADLLYASATTKANGMAALAPAITWHQLHLMGWGTLDPWQWNGTGTRPAAPTNWASLDAFLTMVLGMGGKIALNTQLYSWHLKGKWMPDGTTVPMNAAEAFSDSGVLMTSKVPDYLLLIQKMAERYLVAPYNVKMWITGTEFHGLYQGRSRNFNEWRYDAYAGTAGNSADMGMAYLHNITVDKITEVAIAKGIDPASLIIVNNYPPIISRATPTNDSVAAGHPLRGRPWGTANKQGPSILANMPPLLKRLDAIGFDMATGNMDRVALVDDLANLNRIDDIVGYTRTTVPNKPVAILEMYDKLQAEPTATAQQRASFRAEAYRKLVLNGVWTAFIWGTAGEAMNPGSELAVPDAALLTDGGQSTPMLNVVKLYHDHFGPATPIYDTEVAGEGVSVLASNKVTLLNNRTNTQRKVALRDDMYTLNAYEQRVIPRGG